MPGRNTRWRNRPANPRIDAWQPAYSPYASGLPCLKIAIVLLAMTVAGLAEPAPRQNAAPDLAAKKGGSPPRLAPGAAAPLAREDVLAIADGRFEIGRAHV